MCDNKYEQVISSQTNSRIFLSICVTVFIHFYFAIKRILAECPKIQKTELLFLKNKFRPCCTADPAVSDLI